MMKTKIEAKLTELTNFFFLCDNLHYRKDDACCRCPFEEECKFFLLRIDNGKKLDGLQNVAETLESK